MTNKLFLFSCEHEDISIVKMEQVASHLVGLLRHSNMTRSEIALQLGWKKSRVTKVLSGEENLTIKTISKISRLLGYDFDVIFHNKKYERPKQPWQIDRERKKAHLVEKSHRNKTTFLFDLQTGQQVVEDVLSGNEKEFYISVNSSRYNNGKTINIVAQEVNTLPNTTSSYFNVNQEIKVGYEQR